MSVTREQDPQGNQVTLTWSAGRLTQIHDAVASRSTPTTITYLSNTAGTQDYYKIASVTDPFGRVATLQYGPLTSGNDRYLVGITDVANMTSTFNYRSSDNFLCGMTTPYGTTAFDTGSVADGTAIGSYLTATDPLGQTERLEFNQSSSNPYIPVSDNSQLVPSTAGLPPLQNLNLYYRNSFYWSKAVMAAMGGVITPSSYTNADIYHWCHSVTGGCSGSLESFKRPLENRVWYRYPGQDVTQASGAWTEGTNTEPAYVARVLDAPVGMASGPVQLYQYAYNCYGKLSVVTNPVGRITWYNYYANQIDLKEVRQDNPASQSRQANGGDLLASYTYDTTYPRLVSTATDASGKTTSLSYTIYGLLQTITDPRGKVTTFNYDYSGHSGFLHTVVAPVTGAVTTFTPDAVDRIATVADSDNYTVAYAYDTLDRATNVTYPDATYVQTVFSKLDPVLVKDRQGNWTGYEYDPLRHMVAAKDSLGRVTQYNWCSCGNLESIVDAQTNMTTWNRDLQNRVTQKVYPDGSTTSYTYENTTSRMKGITDAKGQTTQYAYNVDDTIQEISYLNAIIPTYPVSFTYDPKYDRVATMQDVTGTTTYIYNTIATTPAQGAGRLASVSTAFTGDTIAYKYDEMGRITNRAIDSVSQGYKFDDLGRLSNVQNALGSFAYNYYGGTLKLQSVVYPLNSQQSGFAYFNSTTPQNEELLQTITNSLGSSTLSRFDYQYDALGRVTTWARQFSGSSSTFYQFQYDTVNQLVGAALTNGTPASPTTLANQYFYSYDPNGNRSSMGQTNVASTSYTAETAAYNNLNQLMKRTPGVIKTFAGTATAQVTGTTTHSVAINGVPAPLGADGKTFSGRAAASSDQGVVSVIAADTSGNKTTNKYSLTVTASGTPTALTYDLNGNLISSVSGTNVTSYDWDGADRLAAINYRSGSAIGTRTEFTYDGLGHRVRIVEKNASGTVTSEERFVWDGTEICEQRSSANSKIRQYFPQGMVVIGDNSYYYTRDQLSSVREMVDSSGTVRARYDYDPYGTRGANQITSGAVDADFGFTGHYYHAPSGLYLAPFRAYNPGVGRWLSRDGVKESGGINLYEYAGNDFINAIDPLGFAEISLLWGWSGTIGAGVFFGAGPFVSGSGNVGVIIDTSDLLNSRITGQVQGNAMWGIGFAATGGTGFSGGVNTGKPAQTGLMNTVVGHGEAGLMIPDLPVTLSGALDIDPDTLKGLIEGCPDEGINIGAGGDLDLKAGERAGLGAALLRST